MKKSERQERLEKQLRRQKRQRLWMLVGGGVVLLGAGWLFLCWITKELTGFFLELAPAQRGVLEETYPWKVIILREEKSLLAPVAGRLDFLVMEGERVAAGAPLAYLTPLEWGLPKFEVRAPEPGVVCFHVDGREAAFSPKQAEVLAWETQAKEVPEVIPNVQKEEVSAGGVVCKLIDSLQPVVLWGKVPAAVGTTWKEGKRLSLRFPGRTTKVEAVVRSLRGEEAFLELPFFPDLCSYRRLQVELVTASYEGVILPGKAVIWQGDKLGVYLNVKGRVHWVPVEVKGRVREEMVVKGIEAGTLVILNPERAREGMPLD